MIVIFHRHAPSSLVQSNTSLSPVLCYFLEFKAPFPFLVAEALCSCHTSKQTGRGGSVASRRHSHRLLTYFKLPCLLLFLLTPISPSTQPHLHALTGVHLDSCNRSLALHHQPDFKASNLLGEALLVPVRLLLVRPSAIYRMNPVASQHSPFPSLCTLPPNRCFRPPSRSPTNRFSSSRVTTHLQPSGHDVLEERPGPKVL